MLKWQYSTDLFTRSPQSVLWFLAEIKGELNVDKKWQSDDLFYIIMNEIRPRVDQFQVILKKL